MNFRPCIDLHDGKVKQIVGSSLKDADAGSLQTNFESDQSAAWFASLYKKDNLTGGHVIMLGPGNQDAALQALAGFPGGLQIGGGITPENAQRYLDAGASHVIISSYIFTHSALDFKLLETISRAIGKKRLVLDLSCSKFANEYYVMIDRWQTRTNLVINAQTFAQLAAWCDEFLIHATQIEGLQKGIDAELVELLGAASPLPVTYAGGIRSLTDLDLVKEYGRNRVDATIGSALDIFGGTLSYDSVVAWHRKNVV
jgi:phosphoribosylformimino-5-aminoimidazole carboxamide ribotide isomerase